MSKRVEKDLGCEGLKTIELQERKVAIAVEIYQIFEVQCIDAQSVG